MSDMGQLLDLCTTMRNAGASDAEIERAMQAGIAKLPSTDPLREPRYKCHKCLDRGRIEVWNPDDIEAIRNREWQGNAKPHVCAVACDVCELGAEVHETTHARWKRRLPRFDNAIHCRSSDDPIEFATRSRGEVWTG